MLSCSHSSSTEAYQKIRDVQQENVVKNILCDTLNIIDTECREDLDGCYSDDDIVMMTVSPMKEMKKFLVMIARGKVVGEALERCETPQLPNYEQKGNKALHLGKNESLSNETLHNGRLNTDKALEKK